MEWINVDMQKRTVTIRDHKDPRRKDGDHQIVPLLNSTGYDAWQLILEQRIVTRGIGRVFPYHSKSVGAAFHRSCNVIDLNDLCFHNLRHERTSRLFEAGFSIQQVALVTGHKDWRMLRRYTTSFKTCTRCKRMRSLRWSNSSQHGSRHPRLNQSCSAFIERSTHSDFDVQADSKTLFKQLGDYLIAARLTSRLRIAVPHNRGSRKDKGYKLCLCF
jgi:hypothetical protein